MSKHIAAYVAILLSFVAADMVWLLGIARSTYVTEMGGLLRKQPNLLAAILFYLLYAAGIWLFAVRQSEGQGLLQTTLWGAALGLVAYGTYDLTGYSVIEGFGLKIALVDLAWGTAVTGFAALIGAASLRMMG